MILIYIGCRTNANLLPQHLHWNHPLLIYFHTSLIAISISEASYEQQRSHILILNISNSYVHKKCCIWFFIMYLFNFVGVIFFFYQDFFSRTLTTHRAAGEGSGPFFILLYHFHPLTNIRHLFSTLHKRWQSHIFNHTACIYRSATRWDLPPYRITTIFSPPLLFRSSLNDVQKPCIKSWEEEKQSSSFVPVIIKISVYSVNIYLSKSNLFLLEFMFT